MTCNVNFGDANFILFYFIFYRSGYRILLLDTGDSWKMFKQFFFLTIKYIVYSGFHVGAESEFTFDLFSFTLLRD